MFDYAILCGPKIEKELRDLVNTVKEKQGARNIGNTAYRAAREAAIARQPTFNPRGLRPPTPPHTPPPDLTMAKILSAGQTGASRRMNRRKKTKKSRKTLRR